MDDAPPPVVVRRPEAPAVPLVFDSPHSGNVYPAGFETLLPMARMRRAEDAFVDELFGAAPQFGATLVAATFPRLYLDPNRAPDDFDPNEATGDFSAPLHPTKKAAAGKGIVWTRLHGLASLYNEPLSATEVQHRIETCWRPYHSAVKDALDAAYEAHGAVYHVDCHSMRARGNPTDEDGENDRPDFVISDGEGATSGPEFLHMIHDHLTGRGYNASINDPYKGADLIHRYSNPASARHSIQIEINRRLYMDEAVVEKISAFEAFRDEMTGLIETLATGIEII